jgi:hypothetical protein
MAAEKFKILVSVLQRKFNPQPSDYKVLDEIIPESPAEFRSVKVRVLGIVYTVSFLCTVVKNHYTTCRKQYELVYPSPTVKKK